MVNLTPKEKAKELYYKFFFEKSESISCSGAKLFSLIAVDEIIDLLKSVSIDGDDEGINAYWQQVKLEINKL